MQSFDQLNCIDIALEDLVCSFTGPGSQKTVSDGIGVARIFDWGGGPNHKSHAMTSSEIFKKGTFCGAKIS